MMFMMNVNVTPEQKYVPKGTSARSRSIERLVARFRFTTSSQIPRNYLKFCMWIPTGREFILQNGKLKVVKNKHVATFDKCDSEFTPNPMEPNSKRFPNTNFLFLAGYRNMSLDRRLGLLQAHDREFKAADQFHLEIHGNCTLWK